MDAVARVNRQWILARRPGGPLALSDLEYRETPLADETLRPGEILVRNRMFTLVPAIRTWMEADSTYMPPIALGAPVSCPALGEVVASADPRFGVGSRVSGMTAWEDYSRLDTAVAWVGPVPDGVAAADALGLFGGNSLTAYFGLLKVGQPQPGETVLVSGAAGSTGSMAAQIAKVKGCRVIGIAGGGDKCAWLTDTLKLDGAIDYKAGNVAARLRALCPDGIDVFFDNVGGDILSDAVETMAMNGRIVLCGQISAYDGRGGAPGPRDMLPVIFKRLRIQGFISSDYMAERDAAVADLARWAGQGRLIHRMDVRHGFTNLPQTFQGLFSGANNGTLVLEVDG
jgi:NADPH-dependent curcumin reductase CurA